MSDEMRVIACQLCDEPWGIIGTSAQHRAELERVRFDLTREISETEVVRITDASAHWLQEEIGVDCICEPPVWQEQHDIPDWWWRPRAKAALRVECGCE